MYNHRMNIKLIGLALFLALSASSLQATELFESNDILSLTMEYNIKKFRKDRGNKRDYHPAILSYVDSTGKTITIHTEIKARGKLRRMFLKCTVPVFKIKFNEKDIPNTIFANQKSLKVVTHCKNKPKRYESWYIQEYLIYRMYNILTDISFRVRMAQITYKDNAGKSEPFTRTAFFIESYKRMAERIKAKTTKVNSISLPDADFAASTLVSVFQYMIGNTDWSIRSGHNIKWVLMGEINRYHPIPFDFDLSGIINADYARPDERFPIRSVRERFYRGFSKSMPQFQRTFTLFKLKKEEIYKLYNDFPLISDSDRKRALKYLDGFYKIIDNEKLVKRYFINNYRGRPRPKR